jgi:hypothetical protein
MMAKGMSDQNKTGRHVRIGIIYNYSDFTGAVLLSHDVPQPHCQLVQKYTY